MIDIRRRSPRLAAKQNNAAMPATTPPSSKGKKTKKRTPKTPEEIAAHKSFTVKLTAVLVLLVAFVVSSNMPLHDLDWSIVAKWSSGMIVGWLVLTQIFAGVDMFAEKPRVAAFNVVAMVPICSLTYLGFKLTYDNVDHAGADWQHRTHTPIAESATICMIQIAYQTFGIIAGFIEQDVLFQPEMMGHHAVTMLLGFLNLHPYIHYQIIYFGGVIELSNIPLTVYDMFKHFPKLEKRFPSIMAASKFTFALSYVVLRLILWLVNAYGFHVDSIAYLQSGTAHSVTTVLINQTGNVFLTGLQLFWGKKVVKGVLMTLGLIAKPQR